MRMCVPDDPNYAENHVTEMTEEEETGTFCSDRELPNP